VVQLLLQKEAPDTICAQIGLCSRSVDLTPPPSPNTLECVACEFIMAKVEEFINSSTTEAELVQVRAPFRF
jgi:hypothetical protein